MSGMRKRQQAFLGMLEDLPVQVISTEFTGSGHLKVTLQHATRRKFFVFSGSSSDVRATKNFRSEVLKWVKQEREVHAA